LKRLNPLHTRRIPSGAVLMMFFPDSGFLPDKENILIIKGKQLASIKKLKEEIS